MISAIKRLITRQLQEENLDKERILTRIEGNLISVISAISAAGKKEEDKKFLSRLAKKHHGQNFSSWPP